MEPLLASLSTSTVIGVGSFVAHNVIPRRWQFWTRDDYAMYRPVILLVRKIAKDITKDGEFDGDTVNKS